MTHVSQTPREQILLDFVKQFYAGTPFIPKELMLQEKIEDQEVLEQWLTREKGSESLYPGTEDRNQRKAGRTGRQECKSGAKPG